MGREPTGPLMTNGSAPKPYMQRKASTLFLRVPVEDWPRVVIGEKTEFRTLPREGSVLHKAYLPTPVVAYCVRPVDQYVNKLMVLLERRIEPVFAISDDPAAIAREGFESYDEFRRYWRKRRKGAYRPMERVQVWRVRPYTEGDMTILGAQMFRRLYGDFLPT